MTRGQDPRGDLRAGVRSRGVRLAVAALLIALLALPAIPAAAASPTISISPTSRSLSTTDNADFTVTYEDENGVKGPGVYIGFSVTGANTYSNPIAYETDTRGQVRFSYRGKFRGTDTVTAWVDHVRDGKRDPDNSREVFTTAKVTWSNQNQATNLTLTPERTTPVVGTAINLSATVKNELGNPVTGITVHVAVTGANPASGIGGTDEDGNVKFSLQGKNAGTDTITAFADTNGNSEQNEGEPTDTKTVTWIPSQSSKITLAASNNSPITGTEETVTATLKDTSGNSIPGAEVRFEVTGANSADDVKTTDKDGKASLRYTGTEDGADTVTAFVDFNQNENHDVGEPSNSVTVTWSEPSASPSPSPSPSASSSPSPSPAPDGFGPAQPTQARNDCTFFPETQHNLCGGFSDYWNKFGGLAVYGLPLTEEFQENGVTTQYFERARFEWHPGSWPERSDVLLGLVGNTVTTGRSGEAPFRPTSANSNCDFHAPTGHNLCGGFRDYWNNFGGLAVYGMPISEEFAERNPDDGQVYTVQYFERARFEWHPGAWPERSDVMLGRLGAQVLNSEHGGQS